MLTITLTSELEVELTTRARQNGSTPEQVALDVLTYNLIPSSLREDDHPVWVSRLRNLASPAGISLSEESLRREAMYD